MSKMIRKLKQAIDSQQVTVLDISETLKVSPRTIHRWLKEESKPKIEIQYLLSRLLDFGQIQSLSQSKKREEYTIRNQIDNMLMGLRESFYRWGEYSSRNEAIEDLCKLLLAQISLIKNKHLGLNELDFKGTFTDSKSFINKVNESVYYALNKYSTYQLNDNNYKLSISSNQIPLITEIRQEFNKVDWSNIGTLKRLDLFNEIFGKFLANSFIDEKEMGQYLTPIEMTRFMVRLALQNLDKSELEMLTDPIKCKSFGYILDPSCGAGSLLVEIIHQLLPIVLERNKQSDAELWISNMGKYVLFGIDKSQRMYRFTNYNFCSLSIPCKNIYPINSLDTNSNNDLLSKKLKNKVRIILTNPPFGAEFRGNEIINYKIFKQWSSQRPKKIDSELLFIERYVDWLANNGHCISVVPDSILTNRGLFQDLRNGIHPSIELKSVISFPSETFSAAGTTTKTSVINFMKSKYNSSMTYFGICNNVGFRVLTKGSNKIKVPTEGSELDAIIYEINDPTIPPQNGRWVKFDDSFHRWDANYHASLNEREFSKIESRSKDLVKLSQIASLVNDKVDPRRVYNKFRYIEISDIQSSGNINSKIVSSINAPSRARKQVRHNDVLASTVRPEQKKIGYVNDILDDGAICTTGLAILRPISIRPSLLVELMKSDFVTKQLMRHNIGIAYPAVDESCFINIILPIKRSDLVELNDNAAFIESLKSQYFDHEKAYHDKIQTLTKNWTHNSLGM